MVLPSFSWILTLNKYYILNKKLPFDKKYKKENHTIYMCWEGEKKENSVDYVDYKIFTLTGNSLEESTPAHRFKSFGVAWEKLKSGHPIFVSFTNQILEPSVCSDFQS